VTSIPQIEKLTGLKLFNNFDQVTEARLKGPVNYGFWKLR